MLALHGLGRLDVVPAGDLGYLELVGRLSTGNPKAVADEAEVRGFFAPYAPWAGLGGGGHLIRARSPEALAGQELVDQRRRLGSPMLEAPGARPALVVGPVDRVLPAGRLLGDGRGRRPERGLHDRFLKAAVEALGGREERIDAGRRIRGQQTVAGAPSQ